MDMFCCLLMGHLVGDYLLQSNWMAMTKAKNWLALVTHSIIYTVTIFLFSLFAGGIGIIAVLIVFIAHIILDQRRLVRWWLTNINKSPDIFWLQVMVDQTFHLLILFLIAWRV